MFEPHLYSDDTAALPAADKFMKAALIFYFKTNEGRWHFAAYVMAGTPDGYIM